MKSVALLLLLAGAQAVRFFDIPSDENAQIVSEMESLNKADSEIISSIDHTLEQANRNVAQGEIGRTLAMNKINEIKVSLMQFKTNFKKEAASAVTNGLSEDGEAMQTLAKKKTNVKNLESKQREIEKRLPQVQQLEIDLGLPSNVKDQDLVDVTKIMTAELDKDKAALRAQAVSEAEDEEAKKPKAVEKDEWHPINE